MSGPLEYNFSHFVTLDTRVFHLNEKSVTFISLPHMSVCLSVQTVCPSICLPIHLSICLPIHLSVYPSICLSVCLSVCLSIHLPAHSSLHLSVCLSIHLFIYTRPNNPQYLDTTKSIPFSTDLISHDNCLQ